jgi:hypothetical protein
MSKGKRPPGRPSGRRTDNVEVDIIDMEYGGKDWTYLAHDKDR